MINVLTQSDPKLDLLAAFLSVTAIVFPIDLVTPVLNALNITYLTPLSVATLSLIVTLSGLLLFLRQYKGFQAMFWLPLYAIFVSATVAAAEIQSPEETFFLYRVIGSCAGSTIAVAFKRNELLTRTDKLWMFITGVSAGYVSSRLILDMLHLTSEADYWLFSGFWSGAGGYTAVKIFLSKKAEKAAEKRLGDLND